MSIPEQLNRLARQGMAIPDREQAAHRLRHIGYHRLSDYWRPFLKPSADGGDCVFRDGTAFGDVIALYDFDRRLRELLVDALGHIEVSVRAQWIYHLANDSDGGPLAHLNPALFVPREYPGNLDELKRSYRKIVRQDVQDWKAIPVWKIAKAMSFGQLSKWYKSISVKRTRSAIARTYEINHVILSSLLYNMTYLRNVCAHHSRLWDSSFHLGLRIPRAWAAHCNAIEPARLYNRLVIVAGLMGIISPADHWPQRLLALLDEYPHIPKDRMGFPDNWRRLPFWQAPT